MAYTLPANVVDRRIIRFNLESDIPALVNDLGAKYPGGSAEGTLLLPRDTKTVWIVRAGATAGTYDIEWLGESLRQLAVALSVPLTTNGVRKTPTALATDVAASINSAINTANTAASTANTAAGTANTAATSANNAATAANTVAARTTALENSVGQNLAYDAFNKIIALKGAANSVGVNGVNITSAVTVLQVGDAANPYTNPILRMSATGVRYFLISDLGLPGDQITIKIKVVTRSTTVRWVAFIRQTSTTGTVLGSTSAQPAFGAIGEQTATLTLTIPANAYSLEIGPNTLGTGETLDFVTFGIVRGTVARPTVEDAATRSALYSATNDTTPGVNVAYDAFNRTLNTLGIAAENTAGHLMNSGTMTMVAAGGTVGSLTNPYNHPVISTTGAGGRANTLAELNVKVGDTITASVEVMHAVAAGVSLTMIFRAAGGGAVGDVTGGNVNTTQGQVTLTSTKVVPATATTVQIYLTRGDASAVLLLRFGVFVGSRAFTITEDKSNAADYRALLTRLTVDEALIQTPKIESTLLTTGTFAGTVSGGQSAPGGNNYGGATVTGSFYAWFRPFTGMANTNVVGVIPANPISAGGSVEILVRADATANSAVLARSQFPISSTDWNAAYTSGSEIKVALSATISGSFFVGMDAKGTDKLGYIGGGDGTGVTASRYYVSVSQGSYDTVALTLASVGNNPYFGLYYAPDLLVKRYATATSGTGGGASVTDALNAVLGVPDILLPSQISVLKRANEQFSLYSRNLTAGQWYKLNSVDYDGTYGKQLAGDRDNDCWRLEPNSTGTGYAAPTGTFTLTATIRDEQFNTVKTASSTVAVLDPTANQNAARVLVIGDSITYRGQFQTQIAGLGAVTLQGTRLLSANSYYGEGRGGWKLDSSTPDTAGGYLEAGSAGGFDSPFMFPAGVTATNYRGNVKFWQLAAQVDNGTLTDSTNVYNFAGYALALREGGSTVQYSASTGYPLTPTTGWVVYDPAQAAGSKFQTWNGSAWVAMGTQPTGFTFDFAGYLARYAWAFTAGNPTHVIVLLGTNDWFGSVTSVSSSVGSWVTKYQSIVDAVHTASAAINVICAQIPMPSTQDGIGDSYGAGQQVERLRTTYQTVNRALLTQFDTAAMRTAKTFVSIFGAGIDPFYGMSMSASIAPNRYVSDSTLYVRRTLDGIHPGTYGMPQGGDWLAATVQATR